MNFIDKIIKVKVKQLKCFFCDILITAESEKLLLNRLNFHQSMNKLCKEKQLLLKNNNLKNKDLNTK